MVDVIGNVLRLNNKQSARYNYCQVNRIKKIIASEKCLFLNYIFARLNLCYYFTKKQLFLYANY